MTFRRSQGRLEGFVFALLSVVITPTACYVVPGTWYDRAFLVVPSFRRSVWHMVNTRTKMQLLIAAARRRPLSFSQTYF